MPPQPLERLVAVDESALAELGRGEHLRGEVAERAAQETLLGRDEAELVSPVANLRRQQVGERSAEHDFVLPCSYSWRGSRPYSELDQPVVEERDAAFERMGHRVPVLVAEELGQPELREHEVVLAAGAGRASVLRRGGCGGDVRVAQRRVHEQVAAAPPAAERPSATRRAGTA